MPISAKFSRLGGSVAPCILGCTPPLARDALVLWQSDGFALPEPMLCDAGTGLFHLSDPGNDPMSKDRDGFIATTGAGRTMPGGAAKVIATIASGAAEIDCDNGAGIIVAPITPENRVVALKWSLT